MNVNQVVEKCHIPKLAKDVDECDFHEEYLLRKETLQKHFQELLDTIESSKSEYSAANLAPMFILHKELITKGAWHEDIFTEYALQLIKHIQTLNGAQVRESLKNCNGFITQDIYNECMKILQLKLTAEDFKKYPSLVEVYIGLVEECQDHQQVKVNLTDISISLHLIDNFNVFFRKKGLKCCGMILKSLKHLVPNPFETGNYYEVIYVCLKKVFYERDIELTNLSIACLQEMLECLPVNHDYKASVSDELYFNVLEQIQTESNLYRKAALFGFIKFLINIIGINCVSQNRTLLAVVIDNLETSCNADIEDILLQPVVECLEEWVKHAWCLWKLSSGHKLLSTLLKLLYTCKECNCLEIIKITATLITLCSNEEKIKLLESLNGSKIKKIVFNDRLEILKTHVM